MTDVIEDVQNILQRAVDLLEVVLNKLCQRLNENLHRPLNRKTLVRWIAVFLPNPKDPRLQIQSSIGSTLKKYGSSDSLESFLSLASLNDVVEENLGENIVRYRLAGGNEDSVSDSVFDDQTFGLEKIRDQLTSTPNFNISSCSSIVSSETVSQARISDMEEELAALRKQIAMLVVAQEHSSLSHTVIEKNDVSQAAALPLPSSPDQDLSPNDSGCELNRLLSCNSDEASECSFPPAPPPPPPPPPPLPRLLPPSYSDLTPVRDFRSSSLPDMLSEKKRMLSRGDGDVPNKTHNEHRDIPSMSDVLKEMNNVKLRAVDRSPGGTPLRIKPQYDASDPASIIAQALRKKFANHRLFFSPDSDKENDSSFSSPDFSNQIKTSNQAKTKRKLSLLAVND